MIRRWDERAVTVQIGAVLLLAIVFSALALYQINAVPAENREVEFNHNQDVQEQLLDVRNTIVSVPGGNSGGSNTVTLGTAYSERTFAVNPGPMSGSLRSEPIGEIRIQNAAVADDSGELADVWDDGYETYGLTYSPDYNEYRNAPETAYEHGSLFNQHPNDVALPVTDQIVIDGNEIELVTLRGNLSESGTGSAAVDARALSTSSNALTLENETADSNVRITLPTTNPSHWNETLSDAEKVVKESVREADREVSFELEPGEYNLHMTEVGVGDASRGDPVDRAEYVHVVDAQEPYATVEVRDALNNPVGNVEGQANGEELTTGSDGRARFRIDADDEVTVRVSDSDIEKTVTAERGTTGNGAGSGSAYGVFWDLEEIEDQQGVDCDASSCAFEAETLEASMAMVAETKPDVDGATVEYVVSDRSVAEFSRSSGEIENGRSDTTLEVKSTETVTAYVSSGGSSDSLEIEITTRDDEGEDGENAPTIDQFDVVDQSQHRGGPNYDVGFRVNWTVSDFDGNLRNIGIRLHDRTGAIVDSEVIDSPTGTSESGTTVLEHECRTNDGTCSTYQIEIEAIDETELRGFASITDGADGDGDYDIDDGHSGRVSYVTAYNMGTVARPTRTTTRRYHRE